MQTTKREILHLSGSVIVLTIGFAFVDAGSSFSVTDRWNVLMERPIIWLASFIAVFSGFVFHELAHKIVAMKYGYWAEFNSEPKGLGISLLVAIFGGFLFAAPGAVQIHGRPDFKENGIISVVGPSTNLLLSAAAFPFTLMTNQEATLPTIMGAVAFVNAFLALFNLVPIGNFDGRKVFHWNKIVWGIGITLAFILSILTLFPLVAV